MIISQSIARGQIYLATLEGIGSEQRGKRPVVIVQNDVGNLHSATTLIVPITSSAKKSHLPVHVVLNNKNLHKNSMALLEQIQVLDKSRLRKHIGRLSKKDIAKINKALAISLDLETTGGNND